jgi:hypothetical protein
MEEIIIESDEIMTKLVKKIVRLKPDETRGNFFAFPPKDQTNAKQRTHR